MFHAHGSTTPGLDSEDVKEKERDENRPTRTRIWQQPNCKAGAALAGQEASASLIPNGKRSRRPPTCMMSRPLSLSAKRLWPSRAAAPIQAPTRSQHRSCR